MMKRYSTIWLSLCAWLLYAGVPQVSGQTPARSSCPLADQPASVKDARAALDRDPTELEPRLKLADRLVDQGCYNDAVTVLEAGQAAHPHSNELTGKLRDVRSMLTEQTYIQGLTQAEDAAKLRHSQLRCTTFTDLDACNEVVKVTPNDPAVIAARADALLQAGRVQEAVAGYQRAVQLNPSDESLKSKLTAARSRESANAPVPEPQPRTAPATQPAAPAAVASSSPKKSNSQIKSVVATAKPSRPVVAPIAAAPVVVTLPVPAFSNDAPDGESN